MFSTGLQVPPLDVRGHGLPGEALVLELRLEMREICLDFSRLNRGVQAFLLDLRAADFQQDRARPTV